MFLVLCIIFAKLNWEDWYFFHFFFIWKDDLLLVLYSEFSCFFLIELQKKFLILNCSSKQKQKMNSKIEKNKKKINKICWNRRRECFKSRYSIWGAYLGKLIFSLYFFDLFLFRSKLYFCFWQTCRLLDSWPKQTLTKKKWIIK